MVYRCGPDRQTDRQTDTRYGWIGGCRNGWMGGRHIADHRGEYINGLYILPYSLYICYEVNGLRNGTRDNIRNFFFVPNIVMM